MGVEVDALSGGIERLIYERWSREDPPNDILKTTLSVNDIVFPQAPWLYDELEFCVAYDNTADLSAGGGTAVTSWTHTGGDELFGGPEDEVLEFVSSEDAVLVVVLAGDIDSSGSVDDDDLSLLLANWNSGNTWATGDLNASGNVDDDDLSLLLANWGAGSSPAPEVVPEPTMLSLLAIGACLPLLRRRRG